MTLVDSLVIGPGDDCDLRVADPLVSPRHCRVVRDSLGGLWVVDLGSLNGTWLRATHHAGPRVFGTTLRIRDELRVRGEPVRWAPGRILRVGDSELELDAGGWVRAR